MELAETRNLLLLSSGLPKPTLRLRKCRPIAIWGPGPGESFQDSNDLNSDDDNRCARSLLFTENNKFIDNNVVLKQDSREELILDSSISQCSTPVTSTSHKLFSEERKYCHSVEKLNFAGFFRPSEEMDENNEKSQTTNLNKSKSKISLTSSITEISKDNMNQVVRSYREPPTKSFSYTELPINNLKSSSCTDIDGKALFFNEKGWPVKVMRLTEDSPPKSVKPWPTRSVPTTSCKKSPRKEKSLHTQKKLAMVQKNHRLNPEPSREDKENKKTKTSKEIVIKDNSKISEDQKEKKIEGENDKVAVDSDLKSMLEKLDKTMDKLTSGSNPGKVQDTTSDNIKMNKTTDNSRKHPTLERKPPNDDVKKESIIHSARSNKYNSKEVKAYMQAKRLERKIQMSEESRKRQDMLEIQKKNLEKLKEKALQVLKKSTSKAVDENKPKWQGPIEEDNSEVLPPAIHIFENKIPTARKSKTCVKLVETTNQTNADKESLSEKLSSKESEKDLQKLEEEQVQASNKTKNMEFKKTNHGLKNSRNKLRLSITKPSVESSPVKVGMEAAAMEIVPQLQLEMDSARKSSESQIQSPKSIKKCNSHNFTYETSEIPNAPNNSRRTTFVCSPRESNIPITEMPPAFEPHPKFIDQLDVSPTSSYRKRHQLSPTKTNNLTPKKLCVNSSEGVLNKKVSNSVEDQLRKIQEDIFKIQKEDKEPEKLLSHIKPDGFSVMNVLKMKLLANENKYLAKTNVKESQQQKIITTKNSFDDDTDAPSIISMEEDFLAQQDPLRLSDLQLKLDTSGHTSFSSQLSPMTSKTSLSSRRNVVESLKSSSVSSYALDAPPLVIPESVQNLKLSSNRSFNDLSYPSNNAPTSCSDALDLKLSSYSHSTNSIQEKQSSMYQTGSSVNKTSHGQHSNKQNPQEELNQSESRFEDPTKEIQTIHGSNPAALFLQFHAELSRLDAFDQSLAQVIAAERLHSVSAHLHVCNRHSLSPADRLGHGVVSEAKHISRDRNTRSRSSQYSSMFEQPTSEQKVSPASDESSVRTVTSHRGRASRSASSAHSVVEQTSPVLDLTQSDGKEVPLKPSPHLSFSSSVPLSFSPKSIHILQVLIDDAQFQRKQLELMYKTQEDILLSQYKAELSEVDVRYRSNGQLTNLGVETKRIVDEKYKTPLAKLKERRDQALSNSDARIEYLSKQIRWLKKQKKSKPSKPRSAEASPKKLTPLRSISLTSVVENSSSSESSVGLQTYDDKKRQEIEKDKASVSSRRKIEKEMLWRIQEELARVQEIQKADRLMKSSRSRRDKSTSPLESVPETSTKDAACSVNGDEENASLQATSSSLRTVEEARSTDVYNSESFESPESSETPRQPNVLAKIPLSSKPLVQARPSNKSKVLIKVPLSPRVQVRSKRRGSSGSDESLLLSQNETQSEQSDYESRISALKEQKRQRFAELNRLERELKRAQREQLKATEAALVKQIQAYELKIVQTKKQLEEVTSTNITRPQIKHPRVSDKFFPRTSDVFQKTQIVEEAPKQQEQNASDLDTNSLKSISEASSTETTIQSSAKVLATEPTNKSSIDVENDGFLSVESDVTEALSSVATDGPTVLDTHKSIETEISDPSESAEKSVISELANQSNDSVKWVDAEEFFSQMETSEKSLSKETTQSKVSPQKSVSSGSRETNISEELTEEVQEESKVCSVSQESQGAEDITATPKTDSSPSVKSTANLEADIKEQTPEEEPSLETASEKDYQFDEGRVISIVSQSPSNKSHKSVSGTQSSSNTEIISNSQQSISSSKPEFDASQGDDDDDVNVSVVISEKTDVSEVPSKSTEVSVATDSNLTSQCCSADEGNHSNSESDAGDSCDSSQSDVIKVFVSNKTYVCEEQASTDNNNVNLNETYLVSEAETKPDKDETIIDNITDKILQNLLNECLACKKDDQAVRVSENSPKLVESDESTSPAADVESKAESLVNDFAQTVLNKYLKDATDCMLKIKDAKKTAQINSINLNYSRESHNGESPSNKLLEALALERKSITSEKSREENTPSPKSTRSSNNEVELSEGNESEVFWFDEDLTPVSLQTQREAEELRLKELQIEREIEQIKKLEAQESIPYYCLRQIPNKPPPPYTPPGQSVQAKDLRPVPTSREDIERLVTTATQELTAVWRRGDDLSTAEPADEYRSIKIGNQVYNKFLFDLVKQIYINATTVEGDENNLPPWERTGCRMKRVVLPKLTEESVSDFVMKKVRVLFGFEPDSIKENLIIQWSRKKRDKVDELLVRESQEEERDWTDYSKCEVAVKNNIALTIFDNLVEETGQALSRALQKKLAYCQQST